MATAVQVDKSRDKVRRMFAQIAPRYDRLNQILSLNIDRSWRRRVVDCLDLTDGIPCLDVCTGTGELALEIARRYPGKFQVIGTDFCDPMLDLARKKVNQPFESNETIRFIEADTESLPFPDNTFQAVTVAFGIRNVANTENGVKEMLRVARPDAQVAILEFSQPSAPILKQLYQGYFQWVLPTIGQVLAKNTESAYRYLPQSVSEFPSGAAMVKLLEQLGMVDVETVPLTLGVSTIYLGRKPAEGGSS